MAKRKRIRATDHRDDDLTRKTRQSRSRPVRRLIRRVGLVVLLLVGLLVAAPTIISQTALRDTLLAAAMPPGWRIETQQAVLGWTGRQTLSGVTIADTAGTPLLTAESMTLSRSLLALAINASDLGKVTLVRPTVYLETRPDGSNWEDLVVAWQQQSAEAPAVSQASTSRAPQLTIDITEGAVQGFDTLTGEQWLLSDVNVMAAAGELVDVQGSAQLATQNPPREGLLKFHWQPAEEGQQLDLLAERLPLAPLRPWLSRLVPGAELAGRLSTQAALAWRAVEGQPDLRLQSSGRLEISDFDFSAASFEGDRLRSGQCQAEWEVAAAGDSFVIRESKIETGWAALAGSCSLTLDEQGKPKLSGLLQQDTKLSGSLNLAQLAAMLPRTLQLRQGVSIDAGVLKFEVARSQQPERASWQLDAVLEGLVGRDRGRQIRWKEPVTLEAELLATPDAWLRPERLTLNSGFAKVALQASPAEIRGDFQLNLDRLASDLGQFVDLEAWQLRGLGEGNFKLARQPDEQFLAGASIDLTDLQVAERGQPLWSEPKLKVRWQATGAERNFTPTLLTTSTLDVHGSREALRVELLQPVDLRGQQQIWNLQVEGNGPLASWAVRLRPWFAAIPRRLEGDAHVRAKLQVADEAIQVTEATGNVVQLRVENDRLTVDEPRVEFTGDGRWETKTSSLRTEQLQLLGSSFSLLARDVAIALAAPSTRTARGSIAFSANLERLAAMTGLVGQSSATWPQGTAVGKLQLSTSAEQVQADFGIKVEQLKLVRTVATAGAVYGRPEVVWTEPQLELTGVAKYLVAADRARLDNLQIRGKTLRLTSSVSLDQVQTTGQLQASGLLEYDPNELAKLVASYGGQTIQLQGDQQVRFQVAGPLLGEANTHWAHRWEANAEAGWSSAGAYGLPLGGGRLSGTLHKGQLQIAPLDIAVGQGRLTAQPQVHLTPGVQQLHLPKGPLVTNVAISQEVSETMLKYVAPILAGATRAEGQFSVNLDQAEIPLRHPKTGHLQGQLAVHRLNVSPGPMVAQLATLIKQIEALSKKEQFLQAATSSRNKAFLTVSERQIDFQVTQGRVYHRNLEFMIDGVPVRSYGSVGFDQTLALMIEVPFQDKWIEDEPALRGFAGQSLQLPIRGTFQKPRIDERAVADLSKQLLQGAATQVIGDELNKQLNKLFGK